MRITRNNQNSLKQFIILTPLIFTCIGLLFMGMLFLQGYDVGNALPHINNGIRFANDPGEEPLIDTLNVADTSELPARLPSLPTPAKQTVIHAMQRRAQATPQPSVPIQAANGLATSAEKAATNAGNPVPGNVLGSSDNNGDGVTDPGQTTTTPTDPAQVPPVSSPNLEPIAP